MPTFFKNSVFKWETSFLTLCINDVAQYSKPASHKSKPSFVPQGYVDLYLGSHGRGNTCGTTCRGWTLTGIWPTQAKVEGIVLKAAWHWGSNSSVINDPPGEPGLLSMCGSADGDNMFSPHFVQLRNWGLWEL